jgi:hypothetical protein
MIGGREMENRNSIDRIEQTGMIGSVAFLGLFILSVIAVASVFIGF